MAPKKPTKRGKPGNPGLSKAQKERRRIRAIENLRRGNLRCSFLTKANMPCMACVVKTDIEGFSYCNGHKRQAEAGFLPEMKAKISDFGVDTVIKKAKLDAYEAGKTPQRAANAIDQALGLHLDAQEILKKNNMEFPRRERQDGHKVKFLPEQLKTGEYAQFGGVDLDYYSHGYKNDHIYLLDQAIKFAYANVNILYLQLQKIENEEERIKVTEMRGTQIVQGQEMDFENTTIRHSTPFEVKIKLFDSMTKAQAHLASLLKQKEQLLVTALSVMRKIGIKFDRNAGQMVVVAEDLKIIEEASDGEPLPIRHGYVLPDKILRGAMEEVTSTQEKELEMQEGPKVHRVTKAELIERNEKELHGKIFAPGEEESLPMIDDDW